MRNFLTYQQFLSKFPDREIICYRAKENEGVPVKPGSAIPYLVDLYWVDQEGNTWLKEHTKNHMIPHFAFKFYVMDNGEPEKGEEIPEETMFSYCEQAEEFCETREWKKGVLYFPDLAW